MTQIQTSVGSDSLSGYLARYYGENESRFLKMGPSVLPTLTAYRKRSESTAYRHIAAPAHDDGYLVSISLQGDRHQLISQGRFTETQTHAPDSLTIRRLSEGYEACLCSPFDFLFFHLPRSVLEAITEESGAGKIAGLRGQRGVSDPVVAALGRAILPALSSADGTQALFVEHVALAIGVHLAQTYGGLAVPQAQRRGGLSRIQERRAKEFLLRRVTDEVSIAEVAAECRLSRSYFIRAFRETTGKTPHKWLLDRRIELAKELLLHPETPIVEIAVECGFADQSHLTRAFTSLVGVPPGRWRREFAS